MSPVFNQLAAVEKFHFISRAMANCLFISAFGIEEEFSDQVEGSPLPSRAKAVVFVLIVM